MRQRNNICLLAVVSMFLLTGFVNVSASDISVPKNTILSNTIYVDDDNMAGPWDGTQEHPYQNIQDGIDHANYETETIYVYSGTYYEGVDIDLPLSIQGENKETTTIDRNDVENGRAIVFSSGNVKISGFTIRNAYCGIDSCYACTISDTIVESCEWCVHLGSDNKFINNIVRADSSNMNLCGIYVYEGQDNTIRGNTISYNERGMHIVNSPGNIIRGNTISDNLVGVGMMGCNKYYTQTGIRLSNTFKNNGDDIWGLSRVRSMNTTLNNILSGILENNLILRLLLERLPQIFLR